MLRPRLSKLVSIFTALLPALIASGCSDDMTPVGSFGTTDETTETTDSTDSTSGSTSDDPTTGTSAGPTTDDSSTSEPGTTTSTSEVPTTDSTTGPGPLNHDPQAKDDGKYIAKSGFSLPVAAFEGLLANDTDQDGDSLVVVAADPISPAGATITFAPDGSFTYQAPANFWGTDSFGYIITDGNNAFSAAEAIVAVNPVQMEGKDIDDNHGGFTINGQFADDHTGEAVRHAGDVNGDGFADIIVGARLADGGGEINSGVAYVVFGSGNPQNLYLSTLEVTKRGFMISGGALNDESGKAVSGLGDINGDGLDDIIVGAPNSDSNGTNSGRAYVIHGKTTETPVDLNDITSGMGGFMLEGQADINFAGNAASGVGDVNGDGLDDILVGALGYDVGDESFAGRAYVIFGKKTTDPLSLTHVAAGIGGFAIDGVATGDFTGQAARGAGDVNGDGFADLIIGAYGTDGSGSLTGRAYVVFGKPDKLNVNLADVLGGVGGFAMEGEFEGDRAGFAVSGAGDVNGDGLDDVLIGAPRADPAGDASGRAYLIFGRTETSHIKLNEVVINSGQQDNPGFVINGSFIRDYAGISLDSAGDINGDGLDDIIIGAYGADPNGSQSGRGFVVFGKKDTMAISLSTLTLGEGGFTVNGEVIGDNAGYAVSGAGDVNGDGFADLQVCAHASDAPGVDAGRCYVVFGGDYTNVVDAVGTASPNLINGNGDGNILIGGAGGDVIHGNGGPDILYGGHGNDAISIADMAFIRLDGGGGVDTLVLEDGFTADLTVLPDRKVRGFEVIDIGEGGNTLVLDDRSLRALTDESMTVTIEGDGTGTLQCDLEGHGYLELEPDGGYLQYSNGNITLRVKQSIDAEVVL